jgi:uncharacterized protein
VTAAPGTHGAFSWVGLLTGDVERATNFYGELFGWTADPGATADARRYCLMRLRGEPVALIYEIADWQRELGAPSNWATFVSVDHVDESAALAAKLGGGVAIAPYRVEGAARIAVITDPAGARLSLWQALADLAPWRGGSVGTCCWNELATDDQDASGAFYAGLFGWELVREPNGYRIVSNRGVPQGGIRALGVRKPGRAHWLPYFRVGSIDDALERCAEAGGQIGEPPCAGPVAVLRDREGASFGVCARLPSASGDESAAPAAGAPGAQP